MSQKTQKQALKGIFFILIAHILALAMILPLIPLLARDLGAKGLVIGLLISSYSFFQFLISPFWGFVADKWGRKSVIFVDFLGSIVSYLILAFSDTLFDIFLSRIIAGVFSGSIPASLAYIADLTHVKSRSKNMGLYGLAFGVGFVIGPLLGLMLIFLEGLLSFPLHLAALGSGLISFFSLFLVFFLEEKEKIKVKSFPPFSLKAFSFHDLSLSLALLFCMSFFVSLCLSQIEPTLILFLKDEFLWNKKQVYSLFVYIGMLMAFSQGGLIRVIIPRFGEAFTLHLSFMILALSLILIAVSKLFFSPLGIMILGVTGFIVSYSLASSSLKGSVSLLSNPQNQGQVFGWLQSLKSLSRILGPALGGFLYQLRHESPFFIAGILSLLLFLVSLFFRKNLTSLGKKDSSSFQVEDLDSEFLLSLEQLQNLIDKHIGFSFYQVDETDHPSLKILLKTLEKKSYFEILSHLRAKDLKMPIVLICEKGQVSKDMARKLREKGFVNAYSVEGGFLKLKRQME